MTKGGSIHIALRVGGFAALGFLLVTLLHGRGGDRVALFVSAAEIWAITAGLWLLTGMARLR